jgi:two-component system chemotaxis response regulator CheB
MDIDMPAMDGFGAARAIMAEVPTPVVMMSSHLDVRDPEVSQRALRAGAVCVMPKPPGLAAPGFEAQCRQLIATVKSMSRIKVLQRRRPDGPPALPVPGARPSVVAPPRVAAPLARAVGIVGAAGGPAALHTLLSALPPDFPASIFVVQHIGAAFLGELVASLGLVSALPVKLAEDGEAVRPGTVYVAPAHTHLGVSPRRAVALSAAAPIDGCRPSASYLFASLAGVYGDAACAVVLSGDIVDGLSGMRALRQRGGHVLAQARPCALADTLPAAAGAAGVASATVALSAIPVALERLVAGHVPC